MRYVVLLIICGTITGFAIYVGSQNRAVLFDEQKENAPAQIPHLSSIEVLNGCGIAGAANRVALFLRNNHFDVKNIDNAIQLTYPFTIVVSRTHDMTMAQKISQCLHTDKVILLRSAPDQYYDVSVIVGADIGDLIP